MHSFLDQHQRMITQAETILVAARNIRADGGQGLTRARLDLARSVNEHVQEEIFYLNQHGGADRLPREMMRRYHDELLQWRQGLMDCNCAWPPQSIQADPAGFARAFRPILHALRERVRWEEEQLYPQLKAA